MKIIVAAFLALNCVASYGETIIRPLMLDGITIDYRAKGYIVDKDRIYPTLPGSNRRDYRDTGYKIEGNKAFPMYPGSSDRDFRKPAVVIGK